jgi:hypothetical protein
MENEDVDGIKGNAEPDGSAHDVPNVDGQPEAASGSSPPWPACERLNAEKRAFLHWLIEASNTGQGRYWAWIIAAFSRIATFAATAGVAIGLGDGNEFDNVGCSTAQKPVPACKRVQFAKSGGFGIGRTPGAGVGPAGFSVQEDKGPKGPEPVPDCAYRMPGGICRRSHQRCCLLPAAGPTTPIQNGGDASSVDPCNAIYLPPGEGQLPIGEKEPPIPFGDVMRMVQGFGGKLDAMMAEGRAWVKKIGRDIEAVARNQFELRKENEELRQLNKEGYFNFAVRVQGDDFLAFAVIMALGNRKAAADHLKIPHRTFYNRVDQWAGRGREYQLMLRYMEWRKRSSRHLKVSLNPSLQSGESGGQAENPETMAEVLTEIKAAEHQDYPALLADILQALERQNAGNWLKVREELVELIREDLVQ